MNRRSFFGLAFGGVVSAPAALIGADSVVAKKAMPAQMGLTIDISRTGGDAIIRDLVCKSVRGAIAEYNNTQDGRTVHQFLEREG